MKNLGFELVRGKANIQISLLQSQDSNTARYFMVKVNKAPAIE